MGEAKQGNRNTKWQRMNMTPPPWFQRDLAIAQHMDEKASWHWLARFCHWLLISWQCPCCRAQRKLRRELNKRGMLK